MLGGRASLQGFSRTMFRDRLLHFGQRDKEEADAAAAAARGELGTMQSADSMSTVQSECLSELQAARVQYSADHLHVAVVHR